MDHVVNGFTDKPIGRCNYVVSSKIIHIPSSSHVRNNYYDIKHIHILSGIRLQQNSN